MTATTRRKFSQEFKEEAVKLVTDQGYKISEAARNLGIHANVLGRWKRETEKHEVDSSGNGGTQILEAELKQLRRENEQLRMEREILKKAAAFFAKESE